MLPIPAHATLARRRLNQVESIVSVAHTQRTVRLCLFIFAFAALSHTASILTFFGSMRDVREELECEQKHPETTGNPRPEI